MVHGQVTNKPGEELLLLCDLQHMAFLRLLFKTLGYTGPYTDRSIIGWLRVEFGSSALGVEMEKEMRNDVAV